MAEAADMASVFDRCVNEVFYQIKQAPLLGVEISECYAISTRPRINSALNPLHCMVLYLGVKPYKPFLGTQVSAAI